LIQQQEKLKMSPLPVLMFLPTIDFPGTFNELKPDLSKEASEVMDWFENNYVHGTIRTFFFGGTGA
jgi:hypothetical protein